MKILSFTLILSGVLLNAVAQLFLKAGTNALGQLKINKTELISSFIKIGFEPHIFAGLICYVISFVIWVFALSETPVSVAYPMLSIGYFINAVAAWYLFGEILTIQKIIGIGVIMLGVFLVAKS